MLVEQLRFFWLEVYIADGEKMALISLIHSRSYTNTMTTAGRHNKMVEHNVY